MLENIKETSHYIRGLKKIFDRESPAQLIFFVTNRCNSQCKTCFNWRSQDQGGELSLEEIKKISQNMGEIFWLFISGGEPFLRDDLPAIVRTFYQNNHPTSIVIPTNGILSFKISQKTEEIAKSSPKAKIIIQLSIDGIGRDHDKIRGVKGNFYQVQKTIKLLKKLQRQYQNLALQANIVFSSYNQDKITNIYDFISQKFKIDNTCISLIRGRPRETRALKIEIDKYQQAHWHIRKTARFQHYHQLISYLITKKEDFMVDSFIQTEQDKKMRIPCLAACQSAVLTANGDIFPCELLPDKLGNIRDVHYHFPKIWLSKKAAKIRQKIRDSECFCTQECIYTPNVFLNPRVWPRFLKYLIFKKI